MPARARESAGKGSSQKMNASQRFQNRLAELVTRGHRVVQATVVATSVPGAARVGAKMVVGESGRLLGEVGDGLVEAKSIAVAREMLDAKSPPPPQLIAWDGRHESGSIDNGTISVYFEAHNARPWRVYVFGAGHVGQRLTRALLLMDCEVTCVDTRSEWIELLPASLGLERVCRAEPSKLADRLEGDEFVLCTTRDLRTDLSILEAVLKRGLSLPYVGVVGDKAKRKKVAQSLVDLGVPKEAALSVRCPVGAGIDSQEPGEQAIAIAAEMIAVREKLAAV